MSMRQTPPGSSSGVFRDVGTIRRIILIGIVGAIPAILAGGVALAQSSGAPQAPAPPGCASPESRQFDFWVGEWDVFAKADLTKKVAESVIENRYHGCAIRENWNPKTDAGGSLSAYVPADRQWRQTWVDTSGAWVDFRGGWDGQAMVLEGVWPQPGHPKQITRMTYAVWADGSVEQRGDTSDDARKTWQPGFDFVYRRKPAQG